MSLGLQVKQRNWNLRTADTESALSLYVDSDSAKQSVMSKAVIIFSDH